MQTIQELKEELQKLTDAVNEYAKHLEEKEKEKKCPIGVKEVGWIDTNEMLITFDTAQYGTEFEGWLEAYLTLRRFMQDKKGWDDLGGGLNIDLNLEAPRIVLDCVIMVGLCVALNGYTLTKKRLEN
jgi:hypothetical protein